MFTEKPYWLSTKNGNTIRTDTICILLTFKRLVVKYAEKNFLLNTFALSQVSDSELQPINHFSEARVVLHGTWRQNIESIRKTVIFFKIKILQAMNY